MGKETLEGGKVEETITTAGKGKIVLSTERGTNSDFFLKNIKLKN